MEFLNWVIIIVGGIIGIVLNFLAQDCFWNEKYFASMIFAFLGTIIPYVAYILSFSYIINNTPENILNVNVDSITSIAWIAGIVSVTASLFRYINEDYVDETSMGIGVAVFVAVLFLITGFAKSFEITNNYEEAYKIRIVNQQIVEVEEIPIYSTTSDGMVTGSVDGHGNFLGFIVSGTVDTVPVYKYLCRNEQGALVSRYVPADEKSTMIFDTLAEGEIPYLRIEYTYAEETDNNVEPPKVTKELIKTQYFFYVPSTAIESKIEF